MSTRVAYIFPGLWPFIERVARGRDIRHLGRVREIWHCKQIADSLNQLRHLDRASQRKYLEHVLKIRESLAVAIEGIDAAILEVVDECDLPVPRWDYTVGVRLQPTEKGVG